MLHGCSSSGLGHWWHLSPLQRQARDDCPALIPALIIFKAAGIYITLTQAPVALQLPQEAAFLAFPSVAWWVEIATMDVSSTWTPEKHLASWLELDVSQT